MSVGADFDIDDQTVYSQHTLVLDSSGHVWAFGSNDYAQCGRDPANDSTLFTADIVESDGSGGTLSDIIAVAAGPRHSLALRADGRVMAWGDNSKGQLGNDSNSGRYPMAVKNGETGGDLSNIVAISAGGFSERGTPYHFSLALDERGRIWSWGADGPWLGNGGVTATEARLVYTDRDGVSSHFVAIQAGGTFALGLDESGQVWSWGDNIYDQLGRFGNKYVADPIPGLVNITAIDAGWQHGLALDGRGRVWGWGGNDFGQLAGSGGAPKVIFAMAKEIAVGAQHSTVLTAGGELFTSGNNDLGQLGRSGPNAGFYPVDMVSAFPSGYEIDWFVASLADGSMNQRTLAKRGNGTVVGVGNGQLGGLGNDKLEKIAVFEEAETNWVLNGITAIAAGDGHTLALRGDGTVWAWGDNSFGQLGIGSGQVFGPQQVKSEYGYAEGIIAIAAGDAYNLLLRADGQVFAFGRGTKGRLGLGNTTTQMIAIENRYLYEIRSIHAAYNSSFAIGADGTAYGWGENGSGELGMDSGLIGFEDKPQPIDSRSFPVLDIFPGELATIARYGDDDLGEIRLVASGYNKFGQLGIDSAYGDVLEGFQPIDLAEFEIPVHAPAIGIGAQHVLGLSTTDDTYPYTTANRLFFWGQPQLGESGIFGLGLQTFPRIGYIDARDGLTARALAAGGFNSLLLTAEGLVLSAGANEAGQLGRGSGPDTNSHADWKPVLSDEADNPELDLVYAVAFGLRHGVALRADGSVWGWGANEAGQLGVEGELFTVATACEPLWLPAFTLYWNDGLPTPDEAASSSYVEIVLERDESYIGPQWVRLDFQSPSAIYNGSGDPDNDYVVRDGLTGEYISPDGYVFIPYGVTKQPYHIYAVNDSIDEGGGEALAVEIDASNPLYRVMPGSSLIDLYIKDNDQAGFAINPGDSTVAEGGSGETIAISLTSKPTGVVRLNVASLNTGQMTVGSSTVTWTDPDTWTTPRYVLVRAVDDQVVDGTQSVQVQVSVNKTTTTDPYYDALASKSRTFSVQDNDLAGLTVSALSGSLTEAGGTATFTVQPNTQPSATLVLEVTAQDTSEGTVTANQTMTFTSLNWSAKTVTVAGVDDDWKDGDKNHNFVVSVRTVLTTADEYDTVGAVSVPAITIDDEPNRSVLVTPVTLAVTEGEATSQTYTISLSSAPYNTGSDAGGVANLSITTPTQLNVSASATAFNQSNWSSGITVTVSAIDDSIAEGAHSEGIAQDLTGSDFDTATVAGVLVNITDNDTAGITATPTSGLVVTDDGTSHDAFTVTLDTEPASGRSVLVTASVATADQSEVDVSNDDSTFGESTQIELDETNWDTGLLVYVAGQTAGSFTIELQVTDNGATDDLGYLGLEGGAIDASVTGDSVAAASDTVVINQSGGSTMVDEGNLATVDSYDIVLSAAAASSVFVQVQSNGQVEYALASTGPFSDSLLVEIPASVTSDTVYVRAKDDAVDEALTHSAVINHVISNYTTTFIPSLTVQITDNDTRGVTVNPVSGLTVTEGGGQAVFVIALNSRPKGTNPVAINLAIEASGQSEASFASGSQVNTLSHNFDPALWNTPWVVQVYGVDDDLDDGDITFTIISSTASGGSGSDYTAEPVDDVSLTCIDNDTAAVIVSAPAGTISEAGTTTTTYTIHLDKEPQSAVTINLLADTQATPDVTSLTFTTAEWGAGNAKSVTVTAVDDLIDEDATHTSSIRHTVSSADSAYNGISVADLDVTINDDDSAGLSVRLDGDLALPALVTVNETDGGEQILELSLASEPIAPVTVDLTTSDGSEGVVSPSRLTFTPGDYNIPQDFTVTGLDDELNDDSEGGFTVDIAMTSSDANYHLMTGSVNCTNTDDDDVGIDIAWPAVANRQVQEFGSTRIFSVSLHSEPTDDVVVSFASSDTGEMTVSPASLTFTSADWDKPQNVVVTGIDDLVADGSQTATISLSSVVSTDTDYSSAANSNLLSSSYHTGLGLAAVTLDMVCLDDDNAQIFISPTVLAVEEGGDAVSVDIVLTSKPEGTVTITLTSQDPSEVRFAGSPSATDTATVTFDPNDWAVAKSVSVLSESDGFADGNVWASITSVADSTVNSETYEAMTGSSIAVQSIDDGLGTAVGVTVTPVAGLMTSEAGAGYEATFSVVLDGAPTADIVIGLTSSDTVDGGVITDPAGGSLTFTTGNWATPQVVTVTGVPGTGTGNTPYVIQTVITNANGDTRYINMPVDDVSITNLDIDGDGLLITESNGYTLVDEAAVGVTDSWNLRLRSDPGSGATVVVTVTSPNNQVTLTDADETALSSITLTFTGGGAGTWATEQTVTVAAVDDGFDESDEHSEVLSITATCAGNSAYDSVTGSLSIRDVSIGIIDDDTMGVLYLNAASLQTTEAGGTDTFDVVLGSSPAVGTEVRVTVVSNDGSQGSVLTPMPLVFDSTTWSTGQTVTIRGEDGNNTDDGDQNFTLAVGMDGATTDSAYAAYDPDDLTATNLAVNNPPTIDPIGDLPLSESPGLQLVALSGIATAQQAGEVQGLTVTATSNDTGLVPNPTVTYTSPGATGSLSFTPVTGIGGTATITVTVTDDGSPAQQTVETFDVLITAVNDPPVLTLPGDQTVAEDTDLAIPAIALSDDSAANIIQIEFASGSLGTLTVGTLTGIAFIDGTANGESRIMIEGTVADLDVAIDSIVYRGASDWNGIDTVEVEVSDRGFVGAGGPMETSDDLFITVTPTDDAPSLTMPASPSIPEDSNSTLPPITLTEPDGDTVTIDLAVGLGVLDLPQVTGVTWTSGDGVADAAVQFQASPTQANTVLAGIVYTPNPDNDVDDTLSIAVNDGTTTITDSLVLDLIPANDTPILTIGSELDVIQRSAGVMGASHLSASDVETTDPTQLVYEVMLSPSVGDIWRGTTQLQTGTGVLADRSFTQADLDAGLVRYEHNGTITSSDGFALRVLDADGGVSQLKLLSVNILYISNPPELTLNGNLGHTYTEQQGTLLLQSGTVVLTDTDSSDFDTGQLIIDLSTWDADDMLFIEPVNDGLGTGEIGLSGSGVLYEGTLIGTWSGGSGGTPLTVDFNANAAAGAGNDWPAVTALVKRLAYANSGDNPDVTQRGVTISLTDGDGGNGVVYDQDGVLYGLSEGVFLIDISPVNDAPTASAATHYAYQNVNLGGTLAVSDPDDTSGFTFTVVTNGAKGTATVAGDGSGGFTYVPFEDEYGTDTFTYTVTDSSGATATAATITIEISGGDAGPEPHAISDPPFSVTSGDLLHYNLLLDLSELSGTPTMTYQLVDAPVGMQLSSTGDENATLLWTADINDAAVTLASDSSVGYLRFGILFTDTVSGSSGFQQLLILIVPAPTGAN